MNKHQKTISDWLDNIGRERGFSLQLDSDGHCVIPCNDDWSCVVEVPASAEVPAVFIYLPITLLPEDPMSQNRLLRTALEMNAFGLQTGGSQIALDDHSNYLILSFSALVDAINENEFKHVLNDLLELGVSLRERFQHPNNGNSVKSQRALNERNGQEKLMRARVLKKSHSGEQGG